MKVKSIKGKSTAEIQHALQRSMEDGFKPSLAVVFMSVKNDVDGVCGILDELGIQVFGATSSGEFTDGDISHGAIVVLLLDIQYSNFKILLQDYRDRDSQAVAKEMAVAAKELFNNPSFIISASINSRDESEVMVGEPLVRAIESVAGHEVIIWGGRAGDDFEFNESLVFTNRVSTRRGIIMLVLDSDKILVRGEAASGIKAVGTEKTLTRVNRNWVYEIDHQPAAEMLLKYLGLKFTEEEAAAFHPKEGIMFSVSRDKGDPVIRGVGLFNWKDKSFSSLGSIREGDKIRFCLPPDFEVVDEVKENAEKIQKEISGTDALLMFSCVGRLGQFGPIISDEIEGVRKAFKVPMAGFFTYGEFGRSRNGNNEMHTSTCCWVALKEK